VVTTDNVEPPDDAVSLDGTVGMVGLLAIYAKEVLSVSFQSDCTPAACTPVFVSPMNQLPVVWSI
jgi:hypothetical protein